ncbi:MAG: SDR family NAD(P)-dependent oxidoreductase [Candidatus Melainabacteria bacterium]|nr:SDR family NAD(P)-dependent oxidoreductase [Candidatus Melainabacteria bacterium]
MTVKGKRVLVTGGAGFIGSHLVERLLANGNHVTVIDNFNEFYDVGIKRENVAPFLVYPNFKLIEGDIRSPVDLERTFEGSPFDIVVHLAAMAGVRPSIQEPATYMDVNVLGTQRLLDKILPSAKHTLLVFGSSSSVYGEREVERFSEDDSTGRPLSPYAASKMAGEMICHSFRVATGLNVVCLRFFTVYGPRQRPDLAIHKFCKLIDDGRPIDVYGDGNTLRDYTYVLDIVTGIERAMQLSQPGFEVINLGRSEPVRLLDMIAELEKHLGKKARLVYKPMQTGDVTNTFAAVDKAKQILDFEPNTSFEDGIREFVKWYRSRGTFAPMQVLDSNLQGLDSNRYPNLYLIADRLA